MPKFQVVSPYQMAGDQPAAVEALSAGVENGLTEQTLLGVTGSGVSSDLCQRFQLEYGRHDRCSRKMPLEEEFISCQVQFTLSALRRLLCDRVHKQHWRTVRDDLHDLFFIHQHISYTSFLSGTRVLTK